MLLLVRRRLAAAPGRWLGVTGVVGGVTAALVALSAAGVVAGDRSARAVLGRGPVESRAVVLSRNGGATGRVDRMARDALRVVGATRVARSVLFQPARFGHTVLRLAALDGAGATVRLRTGRVPRGRCAPRRCEVIRVGGPAPRGPLPRAGLRLVVVGTGDVRSPVPFGFRPRSGHPVAAGGAHDQVVLLSGDPAGLEGSVALASVAHVQSWSAVLRLGRLHGWQAAGAARRLIRVLGRFGRAQAGFTATSPAGRLRLAAARYEAAPGRLLAAGAAGIAVLTGLLLLAAGGMRPGVRAEDARLLRAGASGGQRALLIALETGTAVALGAGAGALAGALAARFALAPGSAAGAATARALAGALAPVALAGFAAWALVALAVSARPRLLRALVLLALAAAGAALTSLLVASPPSEAAALPAPIVPLAVLTAGLVLAMILPAVLRTLSRTRSGSGGRWPPAVIELARNPAPGVLAAATLAAATGIAGYGLAYHATLVRGHADEARQRVPLAATLTPGATLDSAVARRGLSGWSRLPGAAAVAPILRDDVFASAGPTRTSLSLLAAPAHVIAAVTGRRAATAGALLPAAFARARAGVTLPDHAARVRIPARARGDRVTVALFARSRAGAVERLSLGVARPRPAILSAKLPPGLRGGRAEALSLSPETGQLLTSAHQTAEGGGGAPASGTLSLGPLLLGGRRGRLAGWSAHGEAHGPPGAIRYALTGEDAAIARPPAPIDRHPLPVLADAATAADARLADGLQLDLGDAEIPVRVLGVARRAPTIAPGRRFVLADVSAVTGAVDAARPGAAAPRELWLAARPGRERVLEAAAVRAADDDGLGVQTRLGVLHRLRSEPVAREAAGALTVALMLAAVAAGLGAGLAARQALRTGRRALLDLEIQGVAPGTLRGTLARRGTLVALLGVAGGVALAAALAPLAASGVRAAVARAPDPPLTALMPWGREALVALALLLLAILAGALAVAGALREPRPLLPRDAETAG